MIDNSPRRTKLIAKTLLDRLERISADSSWAHQASGVRASLAKTVSMEDPDLERLSSLVEFGFLILENAAGEIPGEYWDQRPMIAVGTSWC